MENNNTATTAQTYFKGFRAQYTGEEKIVYGGRFYAVIMLEGPDEGRERLVTSAPRVSTAAAAADLE